MRDQRKRITNPKVLSFLAFTILILVFMCGFDTNKKQEYTLENGEQKTTIDTYTNENGVNMLPLQEIVEFYGLSFEECSRCGHDEIYDSNNDKKDEKGHVYVHYYQNLLTYSLAPDIVELEATTDKQDGKTYCSADAFVYIGLNLEIDSSNYTILNHTETENEVAENVTSTNKDSKDTDYKNSEVAKDEVVIIYFYSSTCTTCESIGKYLDSIVKQYPKVTILRYNIFDENNLEYLMQYGKYYELSEEKVGFTPVIFISDSALIGAEINLSLESAIQKYNFEKPTAQIENKEAVADDFLIDDNSILEVILRIASTFVIGLINGLNPCSLSMFLFLLSLLTVKKEKFLSSGIAFCIGKFLGFFLLGSICFQFISKVETGLFHRIIDSFMIVFALAFACLNLIDFFVSKKQEYGKMHLQLPKKVKQMNHKIMKKASVLTAKKYFFLLMFAIGIIISLGEFLCTGQIYLSSIVLMVQSDQHLVYPVILLYIYSFAFVIPLLAIMIVIHFGDKVFHISEFVGEKIPQIKLISSILFIGIALYMIFI